MDQERARALLDQERRRLDELSAGVDRDRSDRLPSDETQWSDGAEPEVEEESDEAVAELVERRREALTRAEERLAAGRYGRSVRSGAVIPDDRLEADPLAELTAEEASEEASKEERLI
jgi:RNA polymerase-binding transcription factor DksA